MLYFIEIQKISRNIYDEWNFLSTIDIVKQKSLNVKRDAVSRTIIAQGFLSNTIVDVESYSQFTGDRLEETCLKVTQTLHVLYKVLFVNAKHDKKYLVIIDKINYRNCWNQQLLQTEKKKQKKKILLIKIYIKIILIKIRKLCIESLIVIFIS